MPTTKQSAKYGVLVREMTKFISHGEVTKKGVVYNDEIVQLNRVRVYVDKAAGTRTTTYWSVAVSFAGKTTKEKVFKVEELKQ